MAYGRAVVSQFGTPNVIQIQHEDKLPIPKSGEVRIRVSASSMVFTDTLIRKGIYPYLHDAPPFTLGYDFVGTIDALGQGVTTFKLGDRVADVTQTGSNSDYIIRSISSLIFIPQSVDPVLVETLLLSGMTAYQMLHRIAQVKAGQRILVQGGTGAVGNTLVQLGLLHGLEVVATASADNLARLRSLGVDAVDYRAPDLSRQLQNRAGNGFDAAFDGVGMSSFRRSYNLLARGGMLVPYGFVSAARMVNKKTPVGSLMGSLMFAISDLQFRWWNYLSDKRSIRNYNLVSYRLAHPQAYVDDLRQLLNWLEEGKIQPLVDRTYSLNEIQEAHEALAKGGIRGRLVITHQS